MIRYPPPSPYDWEKSMRLMEDRLDDHLTDEEVKERLASLDRASRWPLLFGCADPLGVEGTETFARHGRPYIRSALGVLGIVAIVLGAAAVIYGVRGEGLPLATPPGTTTCPKDGPDLCFNARDMQMIERGISMSGHTTDMGGVFLSGAATTLAQCADGWTLIQQANGRPGCAWVVKDAE